MGWQRDREFQNGRKYLLELGGEDRGDILHELLSGTVVSTLEAVVAMARARGIHEDEMKKKRAETSIFG